MIANIPDHAVSLVIPDAKAATLLDAVSELVENGSDVVTDGLSSYADLPSQGYNYVVSRHTPEVGRKQLQAPGFRTHTESNFGWRLNLVLWGPLSGGVGKSWGVKRPKMAKCLALFKTFYVVTFAGNFGAVTFDGLA